LANSQVSELKSQLVKKYPLSCFSCYQRSIELNLKANHNCESNDLILSRVVIKDRKNLI